MPIYSSLDQKSQVLTIEMHGHLDVTTYSEFTAAYRPFLSEISLCRVDFSSAEYINSSTLGMLLMAREEMGPDKVVLIVPDMTSPIGQVISMANFHRLFTVAAE